MREYITYVLWFMFIVGMHSFFMEIGENTSAAYDLAKKAIKFNKDVLGKK